jgi:hypothetical protein
MRDQLRIPANSFTIAPVKFPSLSKKRGAGARLPSWDSRHRGRARRACRHATTPTPHSAGGFISNFHGRPACSNSRLGGNESCASGGAGRVNDAAGRSFVLHRHDFPAGEALIVAIFGKPRGLGPCPDERHRPLAARAAGRLRLILIRHDETVTQEVRFSFLPSPLNGRLYDRGGIAAHRRKSHQRVPQRHGEAFHDVSRFGIFQTGQFSDAMIARH